MALFPLTVGIVSCGRIQCLTACLRSFDDVVFDVQTEVILIENKAPTSSACIALAEAFAEESDLAVRPIVLPHNYGFYAAWNCIATLAHGEWLLMMQDDTYFRPPDGDAKISSVINYAEAQGYLIMNLFGMQDFIFTEWPHLEHRSVRRDLIGDYEGYPRYKDLHADSPTYEETRFGHLVAEKDIPRGTYEYIFAVCQDRANQASIYQRLLHNSKHLTPAEREDVIAGLKFDEYAIKQWG